MVPSRSAQHFFSGESTFPLFLRRPVSRLLFVTPFRKFFTFFVRLCGECRLFRESGRNSFGNSFHNPNVKILNHLHAQLPIIFLDRYIPNMRCHYVGPIITKSIFRRLNISCKKDIPGLALPIIPVASRHLLLVTDDMFSLSPQFPLTTILGSGMICDYDKSVIHALIKR